jgi:hypothetical protein
LEVAMRVLALLLLGTAAQDSYLPLREGARWTYEVEDRTPGAAEPMKDATAFVGAARDDAWVEVANFLGYPKAFLRATAAAVEFRLEASENAPTLTLLKLPAKTRDAWTGSLGGEELRFTVAGEEMVEIGTRREKALHVTFGVVQPDLHAGHAATKGDLWFASGRGLVQAQVTTDLDCHSASMKVYRLKP